MPAPTTQYADTSQTQLRYFPEECGWALDPTEAGAYESNSIVFSNVEADKTGSAPGQINFVVTAPAPDLTTIIAVGDIVTTQGFLSSFNNLSGATVLAVTADTVTLADAGDDSIDEGPAVGMNLKTGTAQSIAFFTDLRMTSESLRHDKRTQVSQELRKDREIMDLIKVGVAAAGGFNGEMSAQTYDHFIAAALEADLRTTGASSTWGSSQAYVTADPTIEIGVAKDSGAGAGPAVLYVEVSSVPVNLRDIYSVGEWIFLSGFVDDAGTESNNNGYFRVIGFLSPTAMVVDDPTDIMESTTSTVTGQTGPITLAGGGISVVGTDVDVSTTLGTGGSGEGVTIAYGTYADTAIPRLVVGQWLRVSGFTTNAQNNGIFRITEVRDSGSLHEIELTNNDDGFIAETGGAASRIDAHMARNAAVEHSFIFEVENCDIDEQRWWYGEVASRMSIDIAAEQILTLGFEFLGKRGGDDQNGSLFEADDRKGQTTTDVMNATTDVIGFLQDFGALQAPVQSWGIQVDNGLREQLAIGNEGAIGIGHGRFNVTGRIEAYFQDRTLYNTMMDHGDMGLTLILKKGTDGPAYVFTLYRLKFASGEPSAGGIDQDVMLPLDYQAIYSDTFGCTMQVDRFPSLT